MVLAMTENKKHAQIQSLLVGFSIIDLIAKNGSPMKFNDIHHFTNIAKSNLYKYLNTLTNLGVLHRDKGSGLYSLGSTLIQYGMAAVNQEDLIGKITPFLHEINAKSKETTLLAVWTTNGPMIVKMIHSHLGLNLGGQVGTILPISSAAGKLFAAFKNDPSVNVWKESELSKLSKQAKDELITEFQLIADQKISFAQEALAPSIASAAIPIFNFEREILGSIIVVGFEKSIPDTIEHELSEYLLIKGKEISAVFGWKEE
jgi:DNA-binding IclR family transcriptional regulator